MATLQEENDLFAAPGSRNLDVALIPRRTFVHVEPEEAGQRGSGGIRRAKMRFVSRAWKRDKPGQIAIEVFFLNSLFIGIEREPPLACQRHGGGGRCRHGKTRNQRPKEHEPAKF